MEAAMIALLAAVSLAAAPETPRPPLTSPTLFAYNYAAGRSLQVLGSNPAVCNKDPRMQKAVAEQAILRDSDRRLYAKRLIDLPMAYMCPATGSAGDRK